MTDDLPRLLTFEACKICGAIEEMTHEGTYKINHDFHAHGLDRPESKRLTTESLMQIPDDRVFDRLGSMREA